jgi:hypothetical protein
MMPQPSALRVVTAGRTCLEVVMRMLLKAVFDTEATNELFRSGEVSAALARLQEAFNRRPTTPSLRTDSARPFMSSTWQTHPKFR